MEVMNRDLQEVMWLFADKDNYKKEVETPLGKEVVELYKQFVQSEDYIPYLQAERDRWVIDYRMQENWDAGLEEGERKSKLEDIKIVIRQLYQKHDLSWLDACSLKQLNIGFNLAFKSLDYEQLKSVIIQSI